MKHLLICRTPVADPWGEDDPRLTARCAHSTVCFWRKGMRESPWGAVGLASVSGGKTVTFTRGL